VFDQEGGAIIRTNQSPPAALTPGWFKRFLDLQKWAGALLDQYISLTKDLESDQLKKLAAQTLTGTSAELVDLKAELDETDRTVTYGIRRIGRASDDDARLILSNIGHYTARPDRESDLFLE
jgi:hypothetical protein